MTTEPTYRRLAKISKLARAIDAHTAEMRRLQPRRHREDPKQFSAAVMHWDRMATKLDSLIIQLNAECDSSRREICVLINEL